MGHGSNWIWIPLGVSRVVALEIGSGGRENVLFGGLTWPLSTGRLRFQGDCGRGAVPEAVPVAEGARRVAGWNLFSTTPRSRVWFLAVRSLALFTASIAVLRDSVTRTAPAAMRPITRVSATCRTGGVSSRTRSALGEPRRGAAGSACCPGARWSSAPPRAGGQEVQAGGTLPPRGRDPDRVGSTRRVRLPEGCRRPQSHCVP